MNNIYTGVLIGHTLIALMIVVLVLLQRGKGADAGAAFGSGASATVFGARGSGNFLSRATTGVALLFFLVCLSLAYVSSNRSAPDSVTGSVTAEDAIEIPMQEGDDVPAAVPQQNSSQESDLPPAE